MMSALETAAPTMRGATPDDLTAIVQLLRDANLPTAGVAEIMTTHPDDFVVAEASDEAGTRQLVAVGGLEVCCNNALLRSVAVKQEWRKHGLGRDLVQRLVHLGEARGMSTLYLLTQTAEHYFPRFGFERIAREDVPPEIAETLEFTSACPASAVAMAKPLG
jgi:amino-acid N-acetyltransferase